MLHYAFSPIMSRQNMRVRLIGCAGYGIRAQKNSPKPAQGAVKLSYAMHVSTTSRAFSIYALSPNMSTPKRKKARNREAAGLGRFATLRFWRSWARRSGRVIDAVYATA